ncbi:unnamed protein product [Prorocentrum cordatum]|uniref:RRM domain-containing protein n=1 Tax=Prorocentrum cordatum TaxID=2364126 RepID=A0ABN9WG97_9DINO|nr:unnamed protein product [Polarella glacialis]
MGAELSCAEGSEPDEGQLLSQLIQLLSTRPHHTLLLSDLSVLLPSNLRKLADSRGGIRAWLKSWPAIIQVSGEPGRESATLTLQERGEQTLQLAQPRAPDACGADGPPPEAAAAGGAVGAVPEQAPKRAEAPPFDEEADGECAVQLRGLPYRATVEDVRSFLGEFAASLVPENAVHLVLNRDGRPSGFARVHFASPEAARLCRDGTHLRCMEDRYVEVFLYSERPSRGRKARNEDGSAIPGDAAAGGAADATGVTKEQVVKEVRMAMAEPKNRHQLLSMLGVALSQGARAYLRQIDQGLKHFLAQFPSEFSVDGGKGCEYVTYRPVQVTDGDGPVPNYTPIQLSEALAPPAHLVSHDAYAGPAERTTGKSPAAPRR